MYGNESNIKVGYEDFEASAGPEALMQERNVDLLPLIAHQSERDYSDIRPR